MSKKEIKIYFKGSMQKIKYYGSLEEEQLKKTVKQLFKINEPLEQIFFQDEEGDILILNDQIPSGLSIHLFVEPDAIPKKPLSELKVKDEKGLTKFHWILENSSNSSKNLNVIQGKYLYTTVNDDDIHPFVRSSCTFEKGIHFFVLRKPRLTAYTWLCICDENKTFGIVNFYEHAIGIINGYPDEGYAGDFASNLGILVDMEHKKCIFYDYDKKIKKRVKYVKNGKEEEGYEGPIDFEKAKLVAWIKRNACNLGKTGITILNGGCIPIPNWI